MKYDIIMQFEFNILTLTVLVDIIGSLWYSKYFDKLNSDMTRQATAALIQNIIANVGKNPEKIQINRNEAIVSHKKTCTHQHQTRKM